MFKKKLVSGFAVCLATIMVLMTGVPAYAAGSSSDPFDDAVNSAIHGGKKNTSNNNTKKNSNTSNTNNTKKSTTQNSSTKKNLTYDDISLFESVYLTYPQMIEWAKSQTAGYQEYSDDNFYQIVCYIVDEKNKPTKKSDKVVDSAIDGASQAFGESLGESLLDWINGEDITFEEAFNKAGERGLKEGLRSGAKEAVYGSNEQQQYIVVTAYYKSKKGTAYMTGYNMLKKNRTDYPDTYKSQFSQLKNYPDYRLYPAANNDFGRDIVVRLTAQGDRYYMIIFPDETFIKLTKNG